MPSQRRRSAEISFELTQQSMRPTSIILPIPFFCGDSYRVLVRNLRRIREQHPGLDLRYRFHDRRVKKLYSFISRNASSRKKSKQRKVKSTYRELIEAVGRVVGISSEVACLLPGSDPYGEDLKHYLPLALHVMD